MQNFILGPLQEVFVSVRHREYLQMRITSSLSSDLLNHRHDATPDSVWERWPYVDQVSQIAIADLWCDRKCAAFFAA